LATENTAGPRASARAATKKADIAPQVEGKSTLSGDPICRQKLRNMPIFVGLCLFLRRRAFMLNTACKKESFIKQGASGYICKNTGEISREKQ
jgi:hypothetical protein